MGVSGVGSAVCGADGGFCVCYPDGGGVVVFLEFYAVVGAEWFSCALLVVGVQIFCVWVGLEFLGDGLEDFLFCLGAAFGDGGCGVSGWGDDDSDA